jgi:hypothetical protein
LLDLFRKKQQRKLTSKMPAGVNVTIPGIAIAWEWFQRLDTDDSGLLDQVGPAMSSATP